MIRYQELKEKSKFLETKYSLNHYEVLQRFMFERILERISVSKYNDNFILKGGLLLTAMFGTHNRTTKDMDTTITGIDVAKEQMLMILNEILSIDLKDGVKFNIVDVTDIRKDDKYGGNKYHIVGRIENLKVNVDIDISTGDSVTPRQLKYKYPLIFENRYIIINSCNLETILAEKIETLLKRGQYNTRMKDYYDIYILLTRFRNEIDKNILKQAIYTTFEKRNSFDYLNDYVEILDSVLSYERIKNYWKSYQRKNGYADGINFDEIIFVLKEYITELNLLIKV